MLFILCFQHSYIQTSTQRINHSDLSLVDLAQLNLYGNYSLARRSVVYRYGYVIFTRTILLPIFISYRWLNFSANSSQYLSFHNGQLWNQYYFVSALKSEHDCVTLPIFGCHFKYGLDIFGCLFYFVFFFVLLGYTHTNIHRRIYKIIIFSHAISCAKLLKRHK